MTIHIYSEHSKTATLVCCHSIAVTRRCSNTKVFGCAMSLVRNVAVMALIMVCFESSSMSCSRPKHHSNMFHRSRNRLKSTSAKNGLMLGLGFDLKPSTLADHFVILIQRCYDCFGCEACMIMQLVIHDRADQLFHLLRKQVFVCFCAFS